MFGRRQLDDNTANTPSENGITPEMIEKVLPRVNTTTETPAISPKQQASTSASVTAKPKAAKAPAAQKQAITAQPVAPAAPAPAPATAITESGEKVAQTVTELTEENKEAKATHPAKSSFSDPVLKEKIHSLLLQQIDLQAASRMAREELKRQIVALIGEIVVDEKLAVNQAELNLLASEIVDDMLGYGPLEPLLEDDSITDIMVNGSRQIYIERKGKLVLTDVTFRDDDHVMAIATRIVTKIGRRIDESSPICDARLMDGSRVNVIIPPLAIKGPTISIRKFSKKEITLDVMESQGNVSHDLSTVLKIASACRLNVVISGGTGSGKTTLLNALSRLIDSGERIVTIEDAAELQLQQPHVVPLETRPPNLEGGGEVTMRGLVKNALRMRPDRIIVGEVRGEEAVDMLQAMNTGHDGSMCTLHANSPREALTRMENMVGMAGINLPSRAVRTQISGAVHLIVQINRMRDGVRRITHVTEIVGMEGDVIVTQDLFKYIYDGETSDGMLDGHFESSGLRPNFLPQAEYYNLDQKLLEAI